MSSKIPFRVIKCTSHDDTYDPAELENNSENPHTKGWQSARFSEFPQVLVLQFEAAVEVHKIQILSHQSKIASSIEVYVGRNKDHPEFPTATFERLGYLSLDSNERSGFRARELKSVYVNTRGTFLKLVIRKCHVNNINLFNQVGIVALNVIGNSARGPLDDLAVGMAVDEKTAKLIRDLHTQKAAAITREDFAEAKRLKLQISHYKQVGQQLADLERRKALAVKNEDFDAALQIKKEIDRMRSGGGRSQDLPSSTSAAMPSMPSLGGVGAPISHDERSAVAAARHSGVHRDKAALHGGHGSAPSTHTDNDLDEYPPLAAHVAVPTAGAANAASVRHHSHADDAANGRRRTAARSNDGKEEPVAGGPPVELLGDDRPIRGKASAQQAPIPTFDTSDNNGEASSVPVAARRAKPRDRNSGNKSTAAAAAPPVSNDIIIPPDERPLKPAGGALANRGSADTHDDGAGVKDGARKPAKRLAKSGPSAASNNSNNGHDGHDGHGSHGGSSGATAAVVDRPTRPARNHASAAAAGVADDHMMPAQDHDGGATAVPSAATDDDDHNTSGVATEPEPLSSADMKDAEPLFEVFGQHNIMCLYSRTWNLRQLALRKITEDLESKSSIDNDPRALFINTTKVLRRSLIDKNAQVFVAATTLLEAAVDLLAQAIKPDEMRTHLEPLVMAIMDKLASATARDRKLALQTLIFLSFHDRVDPAIVSHDILRMNKKDADKPVPIRARAWWLLQCIPRLGFGSDKAAAAAASGSADHNDRSVNGVLSLPTTMKFIKASLSHRDKGVRDLMNKLAALVHITVGAKKMAVHMKDIRAPALDILQATISDAQEGKLDFTIPADELPPPRKPPAREEKSTDSRTGMRPVKRVAHMEPDERRAVVNHEPLTLQNQLDRLEDDLAQMSRDANDSHAHIGASSTDVTAIGMTAAAPSTAVLGEAEMTGDVDDDPQGFCQFCGLEDPTLNSEKLDWHYWQACPMLTSCRQCEQVVEISSLTEHILRDCEGAGTHRSCPRCGEAVPTAVFGDHVARASCLKSKPAEVASRCPLCHCDIPPGDDGWKSHLMTACKDNPRKVLAAAAVAAKKTV